METSRASQLVAALLACCAHPAHAAAADAGGWHTVAHMVVERESHGVGVLNGTLYAMGGVDFNRNNGYISSVEAYHPASNHWTQCVTPSASPPCVSIAPMSVPRFNLGVGVLGGMLYAVGGQNGDAPPLANDTLASVEKYDPAANSWTPVAPMTDERNGAGVGVLGGLLYAVGGTSCKHFDGCDVLRTAEKYNSTTNTWEEVGEMSFPRHNLGVGVAGGLLFAMGGASGDGPYLSSVEKYSPATNSWTLVKPMSVTRVYLGMGVMGGLIYAVGGYSENFNNHASVEVYTPANNSWHSVASMAVMRYGVAVGVLGNTLFATGGRNGDTYALGSVEALPGV